MLLLHAHGLRLVGRDVSARARHPTAAPQRLLFWHTYGLAAAEGKWQGEGLRPVHEMGRGQGRVRGLDMVAEAHTAPPTKKCAMGATSGAERRDATA